VASVKGKGIEEKSPLPLRERERVRGR